MKKIVLRRTEQGWMAGWYGPEAEAIKKLFGSTLLPTGFTAHAEVATVRDSVAKWNPGYVVVVTIP